MARVAVRHIGRPMQAALPTLLALALINLAALLAVCISDMTDGGWAVMDRGLCALSMGPAPLLLTRFVGRIHEQHWEVIRFLRKHFAQHDTQATVRDMITHFRRL